MVRLSVRFATDGGHCGVLLLSSFPVSRALIFLISGATVADALSIGYRTILIDDCCRGVDLNDIEKTKNTVVKNHGVIVQSSEVNFKFIYI